MQGGLKLEKYKPAELIEKSYKNRITPCPDGCNIPRNVSCMVSCNVTRMDVKPSIY